MLPVEASRSKILMKFLMIVAASAGVGSLLL
jgi:hypothetical protein